MTEDISIHASTRGATNIRGKLRTGLVNFNPRSREGSDMSHLSNSSTPAHFNPRFHEGSDHVFCCKINKKYYFNPRFHEGSDEKRSANLGHFFNFNPRFHEGSDGARENCIDPRWDFNPRFHEGSDRVRGKDYEGIRISIHASTRGATATLTNFFFYNQSIFC